MSDKRSATYRRFQDLFEDICQDLGGVEHLSEGQKQLVKMVATLAAEMERLVAMAMSGERELDLAEYGAAADRVGRLLQRLGLSRLTRDVTPSLREHILGSKSPDEGS